MQNLPRTSSKLNFDAGDAPPINDSLLSLNFSRISNISFRAKRVRLVVSRLLILGKIQPNLLNLELEDLSVSQSR